MNTGAASIRGEALVGFLVLALPGDCGEEHESHIDSGRLLLLARERFRHRFHDENCGEDMSFLRVVFQIFDDDVL